MKVYVWKPKVFKLAVAMVYIPSGGWDGEVVDNRTTHQGCQYISCSKFLVQCHTFTVIRL